MSNPASSSSAAFGPEGLVHVVCIGGGFAGLDVLRTLGSSCSVTLLERRSYHEYVPGIPEVFVKDEGQGLQGVGDLLVPFDSQRNVGRVEVADEILSMDPASRVIKFRARGGGERYISYDYAVICTGCEYPSPIQAHTATSVEGRVGEVEAWRDRVERTELPVLVAGAGHVGVELAADIATRRRDTKVILVTGNGGILAKHSKWQIDYVKKFFDRLPNVTVYEERCEEVAAAAEEGPVRQFKLLKSGTTILTECYFSCTGFGVPNTGFLSGALALNDRGYVSADPSTLAAFDSGGSASGRIFAAGDCRDKSPSWRMASFAHFEGEFVGRQILRSIRGEKLRAFRPPPERSFVVSLGPFDGMVSVFGRSVCWGRVVPWIKKLVEWGWLKVTPHLPAIGFDGAAVI
jgi:NADH dehydrogenase FAD-containing subunit